MSTSSLPRSHTSKWQQIKYVPTEEEIARSYEEEQKLVDDSVADFVLIPTKKRAAGLWQSKVDPAVLKEMSTQEIKRQEALHELIESETFYLRDLLMTYRKFIVPVHDPKCKILNFEEVREIFCNFYEIIIFHAQLSRAMRQLRNSLARVDSIGKAVLDQIEDLEMCYQNYCSRRSIARDSLNKKRKESVSFNKFVKQAEQDPECRKLELDTFLAQPWQRLMHYPLLFHNILKKTSDDNSDQQDLKTVIERLNAIITSVNGYTETVVYSKTLEDLHYCISSSSRLKAQEFDLLSSERKFVMEGELKTKWGRRIRGYLIDNCLIFVIIGDKMSLYCEPIAANQIELKTFSDHVNISSSNSSAKVQRNNFQITNKRTGMKISLSTESVSEKSRWVDNLQGIILQYNQNWRDTYDTEFQLHEETEKRSDDTESLKSTSSENAISEFFRRRSSTESIDLNNLNVIKNLANDSFNLLTYAKTVATCTSKMVNQLHAKAHISDDTERKDNLLLAAKVIADSTVDLLRVTKEIATKKENDRDNLFRIFVEKSRSLQATLNLNIDDLEDIDHQDNIDTKEFELPSVPSSPSLSNRKSTGSQKTGPIIAQIHILKMSCNLKTKSEACCEIKIGETKFITEVTTENEVADWGYIDLTLDVKNFSDPLSVYVYQTHEKKNSYWTRRSFAWIYGSSRI